jgi:hypothetical protein
MHPPSSATQPVGQLPLGSHWQVAAQVELVGQVTPAQQGGSHWSVGQTSGGGHHWLGQVAG